MVKEITFDELTKILNKNKEDANNEIVIVDYYAAWCGPCQMFAPIYDSTSVDPIFKNKVKFLKMDIDNNQEGASQQKVKGVPTIVLFKNGEETKRTSGYLAMSALKEFIGS